MRATSLRVRPIGYGAMRLLRLRASLRDFLRRWGIQCAIVVLVVGAGSNAPFATAMALAGFVVWPLRGASEFGWPLLPATVGYAIVGALPVVCARPLWWPRGWALAERALPLSTSTVRRADLVIASIVMMPWLIVSMLGLTGVALADHATGHSLAAWSTIGAWLSSACGSLALSLGWMQRVRRAATTVRASVMVDRPRTTRPLAPLDFRRAVIALPMLRGRAPRTAAGLGVGLAATTVGATAWAWSSLPIGWSLAGLASFALGATGVVRAASVRELQPLWREHRAWPLDARACERARIAVVLLPTIAALVTVVATMSALAPIVRWKAVTAYVVALATSCLVEALTPPTLQTHDHTARWVLMLSIAIACASEITG